MVKLKIYCWHVALSYANLIIQLVYTVFYIPYQIFGETICIAADHQFFMAAADDVQVERLLRDAVERVRALPRTRETRAFVASGERLVNALRAPRPNALLDSGARADVSHAVRDVRDILARATAASSPRLPLLEMERKRRFRVSSRPSLRASDRKLLDAASKRIEATAQVALYKARLTDPGRVMDVAEMVSDDSPARREWEFSLVKSPITPLSARDLDRAPHGALLPALWRGTRVSVRVMRRDRARFYAEGDYLWKLGDSPSIPKLLGGHWQSSSGRSSSTDVGYLVVEVVSGTSLDKLVRQQRLAATLNQLRVLDRIVTALMHAQSVVPSLSHQDLHPGNIFLVPTTSSSPLSCTLTPPPNGSPKVSRAKGSQSSGPAQVPTPTDQSPMPPQTTPATDEHDYSTSVDSANSLGVNDAPVLDVTTSVPDDASDVDDQICRVASPIAEPGSPVRSDATLDARVRRAASTAAARGDVALARGMLSMHSIQSKMRTVKANSTTSSCANNLTSTQSLSHRATGALLGSSTTKNSSSGRQQRFPSPAAYLVKVLDFAPSTESQGRRSQTSWSNPTVAGYCAPEMATPKMWRRAGDHRQRHRISALRQLSTDIELDRRVSSDSSNTTSSAVVHTPSQHRPASPTVVPRKPSRIIARSLSYPRKPAAPVDIAEGVMFADEDAFNKNVDGLSPPFGRVHSLDSAHIGDSALAMPRKMVTHHAALSHASSGSRAKAHRSFHPDMSNSTYGQSGTDGDDDDLRDYRRQVDRTFKEKETADEEHRRLRQSVRRDDPKRMTSIYRRISAHHQRNSELTEIEKADPNGNKTHLTGNILGTVLSRSSGGNKSFDSKTGTARLLGDASAETRVLAIQKVDVWSLGWLLFYMATGEHPPTDAWASTRPLTLIDMSPLSPQVADVMKVCIVHDVSRRICLEDLKRRLEAHMRHALFVKGLTMLDTSPRHAFRLLDKVVGLRATIGPGASDDSRQYLNSPGDFGEPTEETVELGATVHRRANSSTPRESVKRPRSVIGYTRLHSNLSANAVDVRAQSLATGQRVRPINTHVAVGLNARTRAALSTLPLVIVRRVEWEFAARKYECSDRDLQRLRRALICERWTKSEVNDGELAIAYLRRRCAQGVTSAQSALGWVYRWGAGGAAKEVSRAMRLWEAAMESADPEAANGLGLIYHHGRRDIEADGRRAQRYYEIAVEQGYPAAAVNLGVMLHDGAAGLAVDGLSAKALYELACENGDAIAANNLGLLLQHGAPNVEKDAIAAIRAYELAISRGERNHARRNLAELIWDGAENLPRNIPRAFEMMAIAIEEGDAASRSAAQTKLRALVSRDRDVVRASLTRSMRKKYAEVLLS